MGKNTDEMKTGGPDVTERIQEDIRETESEITDTIHNIEERFTPRHIGHEMKEMVKEYSVRGMVKVTDAVRRRPIPIALIGVAAVGAVVGWATLRPAKKKRILRKSAAVFDVMPKKVKKHPRDEVKKYVTMGRVAVTLVSALATILMRQREAHAPGLHQMGRQGKFPVTVK